LHFYAVLDIGELLVVFYGSDVSIGSCPFSVIDEGGNYLIQNVTEYDTLKTGS